MRQDDVDVRKVSVTFEKEGLSLEKLVIALEEAHSGLSERPEKNEPLLISGEELTLLQERGLFLRDWKDGSSSVIMTQEHRDRLRKNLFHRR